MASFSDDDSDLSLMSLSNLSSRESTEATTFNSILNADNERTPSFSNSEIRSPNATNEQEISDSMEQLSTKSSHSSDSDDEIHRKRIRVGNHYQARIPKYLSDSSEYESSDELVWNPGGTDAWTTEEFLQKFASVATLALPKGSHVRDDEHALYILHKSHYDVDAALEVLRSSPAVLPTEKQTWTEDECRRFERGILNFGKNFFRIQKYRVSTREVRELVQFYYLWKKTERYDLYAARLRAGKKKYSINPGISDLMIRYVGHQTSGMESPELPFLVADSIKEEEN